MSVCCETDGVAIAEGATTVRTGKDLMVRYSTVLVAFGMGKPDDRAVTGWK